MNKQNNIFKLVLSITVTILCVGELNLLGQASVVTPAINAQAAIVVDVQSGQILAGKNIDKPLAAASTSKLLTAYLVNQAIAEGKLDWETPVKISSNIANVSQNRELTNVTLIAGHTYPVKKLYQAALLGSANAAAMALGEAVSGSTPKFVTKMQQQLALWGIKTATVNNAAGLLNSQVLDDAVGKQPETENMWSVKTMAIIATHLLNDYPDIVATTKLTAINFGNQQVRTTDMLLPGEGLTNKYQFDGLKTGTSAKAHQNFVGTLKYQQRRLLTVVYGTGPVNGQNPARFLATLKLLDQTLTKYHLTTIAPKQLQLTAEITNAQRQQVKVTNKRQITLWHQEGEIPLTFKVRPQKKLVAPVEQGQESGMIYPTTSEFLRQRDDNVSQAVTTQAVKAQGFFAKLWAKILSWF